MQLDSLLSGNAPAREVLAALRPVLNQSAHLTEEERRETAVKLRNVEPRCRILSTLNPLADAYYELSAHEDFLRVAKKIGAISPWRYQLLKKIIATHIARNDLESAAFYSHLLALLNFTAAIEGGDAAGAPAQAASAKAPRQCSSPLEVVAALSAGEPAAAAEPKHLAMSSESDFSLLCYETYAPGAALKNNIGDEIQSLAASNLVGPVHSLVNRDRLDKADIDKKIIMNGWFAHYAGAPEPVKQLAYAWPPHPSLRPLFVAFHLADAAAPFLLNPAGLQYLKAHEPIGCRDRHTERLLQRNGVDAYFSGCLTLTLPERAADGPRDYAALCDLPSDVEAVLSGELARAGLKPVIVRHNSDAFPADEKARFAVAQTYLDFYAGARFVVTSRLHAALPCLAMNTPVLLVRDDPDNIRFQGLIELVNFETPSAIMAQPERVRQYVDDVRTDHLPLRKALMEKVAAFREAG